MKWDQTQLYLTERNRQIVATIYPFATPPEEVLRGTYIIEDQTCSLQIGYHQTSTAVLLRPRADGNLLVPAVALGGEQPIMNLKLLGREGLPETCTSARRWASWWAKEILSQPSWRNESDFTPTRGEEYRKIVNTIRTILRAGLSGQAMDIDRLGILFGNFTAGFWHRYYTRELPAKITNDPNRAAEEVEELFATFDQGVERALAEYESHDADGKILLDDSFNLAFLARLDKCAPIYVDNEIPQLLAGSTRRTNNNWRDPAEIRSVTQGVCADQIMTVFLPDEVLKLPVGQVAIERLTQLGINRSHILALSGLTGYESCLTRYETGFTGERLKDFILSKALRPAI